MVMALVLQAMQEIVEVIVQEEALVELVLLLQVQQPQQEQQGD